MGRLSRALTKLELPADQQINKWINDDLRPVPPERQTWDALQYAQLWFLVNMNISTYQTGSSMLAAGLSWWQALIAILVGNFLASGFAVLNSFSGATSHLGYPIVSRSVWGMYGAYFPVLNRILLSVVWYGVQAVIGGKMVWICLRAIWLDIDARIPNTLPDNIGITSSQFVGYFIFNVFCCVFIWFKPTQLRPYFHGASVIVVVALFALLGWAIATSRGFGSVIGGESVLSGSKLGWTLCNSIMAVIGSISAGILNQNDYTRFARKTSQATWPQFISFNLSASTIGTIGIFITAATQEQYGNGQALWDLSSLFAAMQDQGGSGARAATFFLAVVFMLSQLSINVPGNVLAGGLDVASVLPKYINLRRGAYILAALSVLPNPWQQLASGSTFLSVLSAYAVFLGPMIGLLCTHFYLIQHRRFHVPDLYDGVKESIYWYNYGVNWRTVVAWVCAVFPSMPGFVSSVNPSLKVSEGWSHVFSLSFVLGFFLAAVLSYGLHLLFPVRYDGTTVLEGLASDTNSGRFEERHVDDKGADVTMTKAAESV
ncbi:permease for cytosine/purines, uracil, thiamine, allantoin-domain-containing protein [Microdochium trichocladiopsis]|uniref:Permease for cytosine/purines, uracil, thiamine, allantoin-domain-containing protein n=1 Tax=Microdochium trichocladiopsis TaxID=1682393 RepID=A0A9P8XXV5_9PEZI|nr:permease for cytosine/purines, uracil, thiamine, allantoin-domain-containing protein [Microdochium trichocladiopsis]KAH7024575.1 permease for cytosine/purines, uracil, thiamine, allantoin-domain-containing protein [Microdochium trichocladiopsis]